MECVAKVRQASYINEQAWVNKKVLSLLGIQQLRVILAHER